MRLVTAASLGASAVLGVAALIVAKTALPQAAPKPLREAAAMLPQQRMTPIVVASNPIAFGDRLDAAHLAVVQVPAGAAPEGAFTTVDAVLAQDDGGAPVALTPIAQREALLPSKLSGPGARPTVAAEIADGMRAYTIKVNDVSGVGGHALPGDRVDVVLMRNLSGGDNNGSGQPNLVSQVVLQNVRVLGVDLNADPTTSKPAAPSTATLEVTVMDAQKLSMAASLGELSLALRRNGAAEVAPAPLVRTSDFINARARPAAPATWRPVAPPRSAAPSASMRVIRVVEGESGGAGV
jgi:pilus assembly protein CpaB